MAEKEDHWQERDCVLSKMFVLEQPSPGPGRLLPPPLCKTCSGTCMSLTVALNATQMIYQSNGNQWLLGETPFWSTFFS